MTTVNLKPNGQDTAIPGGVAGWISTVGQAWQGFASTAGTDYAHDDIVGGPSGHQIHLTFASVALPANAVVESVRPHLRVFESAAGEHSLRVQALAWDANTGTYVYQSPNAIWRDSPGHTLQWDLPAGAAYFGSTDSKGHKWSPQWLVDNLELLVSANPEVAYGATGGHRCYAASIDLTYNEQPTATGLALAPSSAATRTARPQVTWAYADPESDPQAAYSIAVWKTADSNDANCPKAGALTFKATDGTTRKAIAGALAVQADDSSWQIPVDLANGNYTAFVRVADSVAGQLRWSTQTGSLAWTQNVTLPPAPTITGVVWDAAKLAPKITVSAPAWTHTPGTTQDVYVERSTDGGATWDRLAAPAAVDIPGQVTKTVSTWDAMSASGDSVRYRAQTSHDDGTFAFGSTYSATSSPIAVTYSAFYLRDPTDPATPPVSLQLAGLEATSDEELGVFTPAGSPFPVFVSGAVGGRKWACSVTVFGQAAADALAALRARQRTMLLQTEMTGQAWWTRFDTTFDTTWLLSSWRAIASKRPFTVTFTLWESAPAIRDDGTAIDDA